ncbi:hypothetical protein AAXB25_14485 [Paenibacillus lautus]|uniref:hypothetical protein n=1 Tax=Paenibacillus lautus TaxID=1401 RepID=UPI003D2DF38A
MRSWEYEKLFNDDVREKKRIGSNIHKRVATRKGGKNTPLRTPYYYMTNKEKKSLNGKARTIKLNEILPIKEFKQLPEDTQKLLLDNWRKTFPTSEILAKMQCTSESVFYRLLRNLGLPTKLTDRVISTTGLVGSKKFVINDYYTMTYNEFKAMSGKHKRDVAKVIFSKYKVKEVAEAWGIGYKLAANAKSYYYEREAPSSKSDEGEKDSFMKKDPTPTQEAEMAIDGEAAQPQDQGNLTEIETQEDQQTHSEVVHIQAEQDAKQDENQKLVSTQSVAEIVEDFYFTFNKKDGDRKAIIRKLRYLIEELEDATDDTRFDVYVTMRGIERQ